VLPTTEAVPAREAAERAALSTRHPAVTPTTSAAMATKRTNVEEGRNSGAAVRKSARR
jgi:hypothetical protein